ncbi:hypothetical protein A2999_01920 [Candidatus Wolfebacteria bacterium RIFCSPLOWO2_01_FULL_38_11]|uniref:Transcriptional repressor PaaX-like central Cas2-like domain-containing protein n=1 Tax=Candidatus Wolfebacteria bacterium RIFCSPLOWO2_01_FULL_38_11 TaxID=1802556 RepID=A0A1F8DSA1_9BACT|nr:MAG: hypothetical protein A2999_01920 [Candidatus Wolfebacteria bacterium RIFCSPLOWO2_01_FULL_38_11]
MKGETTLKVLEIIKDGTIGMFDAMAVFLSVPYGSSLRKFEYELSKIQNKRLKDQQNKIIDKKVRQRFYSMIHRLEKDGLIEKEQNKEGAFFKMTADGKKRLKFLRERKSSAMPKAHYQASENNNFVIITFDIPESERRKRDWLRLALKNMKFKFIQKSVWIGKVKIPKEFLDDLREFKLVNFVEIFEINKKGTLQQVI